MPDGDFFSMVSSHYDDRDDRDDVDDGDDGDDEDDGNDDHHPDSGTAAIRLNQLDHTTSSMSTTSSSQSEPKESCGSLPVDILRWGECKEISAIDTITTFYAPSAKNISRHHDFLLFRMLSEERMLTERPFDRVSHLAVVRKLLGAGTALDKGVAPTPMKDPKAEPDPFVDNTDDNARPHQPPRSELGGYHYTSKAVHPPLVSGPQSTAASRVSGSESFQFYLVDEVRIILPMTCLSAMMVRFVAKAIWKTYFTRRNLLSSFVRTFMRAWLEFIL